MSQPDFFYIADHVVRIQNEYADRPGLRLDSMWRIASHINLFGRDLSPCGDLTPEQIKEIEEAIETFQEMRKGQEAIAEIRAMRQAGYRREAA